VKAQDEPEIEPDRLLDDFRFYGGKRRPRVEYPWSIARSEENRDAQSEMPAPMPVALDYDTTIIGALELSDNK